MTTVFVQTCLSRLVLEWLSAPRDLVVDLSNCCWDRTCHLWVLVLEDQLQEGRALMHFLTCLFRLAPLLHEGVPMNFEVMLLGFCMFRRFCERGVP